jgi:hypothetical protein
MADWHVGQEIVCVWSREEWGQGVCCVADPPERYGTYVIASIISRPWAAYFILGGLAPYAAYISDAFRPKKPTSIALFRAMLAPEPETVAL